MKAYAALLTVAAVHGVVAAPQQPGEKGKPADKDNLAPPRGPTLPADHVIRTQVPGLALSACYQNSTGQYKDGIAGASIPNDMGDKFKYPCNSEQEITGYCSSLYSNDRMGMYHCLFGEGSTYRTDRTCCIACRFQNQDGAEGSATESPKFLDALADLLKNGEGAFDMKELTKQAKEKINLKAVVAPNTNFVNDKGVADINILTYCPKIQTPQKAGEQPKGSAEEAKGDKTGKEDKDNKVDKPAVPEQGKAVTVHSTLGSFETAANASAIGEFKFTVERNYCFVCASPDQSPEESKQYVKMSLRIAEECKVEDVSVEPKSVVRKARSAESKNAVSLKGFNLDSVRNMDQVPKGLEPRISVNAEAKLDLKVLFTGPSAQVGSSGALSPVANNKGPKGNVGSNGPQGNAREGDEDLDYCE
ncbi:hypothetical protein HRG_009474 [Hirsutella rhossiliensis]|uniref:Uncharacterized protein n=1 Tax=Hirsutella rhossiliensis TaxID=111463 RepID=A0A9P8MRE3_9HYPO|nr:uncharacterized protein HRG_09474 [Hirsutella rhossiliensis]KAH0959692.1 hypothetical protein HRG_09474 [Hirsutella rhossiliensis]